jgi:hypothetical protein
MLQTRALNQKIQELVERQNLEETSEGEIDAGEEGYPQPVEAPKVHPVEDKLLPSEDVKIERAEEGAGSVESVRFDGESRFDLTSPYLTDEANHNLSRRQDSLSSYTSPSCLLLGPSSFRSSILRSLHNSSRTSFGRLVVNCLSRVRSLDLPTNHHRDLDFRPRSSTSSNPVYLAKLVHRSDFRRSFEDCALRERPSTPTPCTSRSFQIFGVLISQPVEEVAIDGEEKS